MNNEQLTMNNEQFTINNEQLIEGESSINNLITKENIQFTIWLRR